MIVIGSCFFPATGDTERRQRAARAALLALGEARPINLQFTDENYQPAGFRTLRVLRRDSRTVTGGRGRRKPVVNEMFDALAEAATAEGCRYFAYLNADIEVTPDAVARIASGGLDAHAFCRVDVDARTRQHPSVQLLGIDVFAIDVAWWRRERRRFRAYIAGEPYWDNVYAAICCSHGRGEIVHDASGVLHERHTTAWGGGAFADYNGYLAALDAPYFSRWVTWVARLRDRRAAGLDVDPDRLAAEIFGPRLWTPSVYAQHVARSAVARFRYARRHLRR